MKHKIKAIAERARAMVESEFGAEVENPQRIETEDAHPEFLYDLKGQKVACSPMCQEFYSLVDGAYNIVFGQRWLSVEEMRSPFAVNSDLLVKFDPLSAPEDARQILFRDVEDQVYAYQEKTGRQPTGQIPDDAHLVLFGYDLIQMGDRPTFLYFSPELVEPEVWSSHVNWTDVFENIDLFLDGYCR